jgi:hypothetical protein
MMTKETCMEVTKGNEFAARFLLSFLAYVHMIDDLHDKDHEVTDKQLVHHHFWILEEFALNPWVRDNAALLWSVVVCGTNAWLDSNQWQRDQSFNKRIAADVIKSSYQEVVFLTAYLCGGADHMQMMSKKYRDYNFERKEVV